MNPNLRVHSSGQFMIYRHFWWPRRRHQRVVIHHRFCRVCNDGMGIRGSTPVVSPDHPLHDFPKQAWIRSFATVAEAVDWFRQFPYSRGHTPQLCTLCCGTPDGWPPRSPGWRR